MTIADATRPRDRLVVIAGPRRARHAMHHYPYPSYLKTHRRRWGLTQPELGQLLGGISASQISRYERLSQNPSLEAVIACEFIFEEPARHLFPGIYSAVEANVVRDAAALAEKLSGLSTKEAALKRTLLDAIVARAVSDQTTI